MAAENYKIFSFDAASGVLGVRFDDAPSMPVRIVLPIDSNNHYPTGAALDEIIQKYYPHQQMMINEARLNAVNAADIHALVTPDPETPVPFLITWDAVRAYRNQELAACDHVLLSDVPMAPEKKQEWIVYRQALRDITKDFTDPTQVTFPPEPMK
jgi:Phage tail assembly chaperone protein